MNKGVGGPVILHPQFSPFESIWGYDYEYEIINESNIN